MYTSSYSWANVVEALWPPDATRRLRLPKSMIPHPLTIDGMRESIGLPEGQSRDYRLRLGETHAGLHVREFSTWYEAHVDEVDPSVDVIGHARRDAPGVFIGGAATLGAIVGASIGKSGRAAVAGAAVVGILAALLASRER